MEGNLNIDILRMSTDNIIKISIEKIKDTLQDKMFGDSKRILIDWVFLALICGNDYTPKLSYYSFPKVYSFWKKIKCDPQNSSLFIIDLKIDQTCINNIFLEQILNSSFVKYFDFENFHIQHCEKLRTFKFDPFEIKL